MAASRAIRIIVALLPIVALPLRGLAADIDGDGFEDNADAFVDLDDDGFHDSYSPLRSESAGGVGGIGGATGRDILIIHDTQPRAFFGWYRASMMPPTGWDLFQRTIDWADGESSPASTTVILFTYNGSLDPEDDEDGLAVYSYLTNAGYNVAEVRHQAEIASLPSSHYDSFDLAIYANGFGYNPVNLVNSGIPFVTVSAGQSDELGIGNGQFTMHSYKDDFQVVDNGHYPTQPYPVGPLTFENPMWTDATRGADNGIVLAAAAPTPTPPTPTPTPPTPIPTPTPPTPVPTPTPEPPCAALNPRVTIVTVGKGQNPTNNAKVVHTITGNIIDPGSLSDTAHRIEVCTGTAVSSTVTDATGTPTNTALGSLACNATGCSGTVDAKEKYQSVSQDGQDKDRIAFIPRGDPPRECPCWTEPELDQVAANTTARCLVLGDQVAIMDSGEPVPDFAFALPGSPSDPDAEGYNCEMHSSALALFRYLLIPIVDYFACRDSILAECESRGIPVTTLP